MAAVTGGYASAGCVDRGTESGGDADGGTGDVGDGAVAQSSFFVFGDFADQVAGDVAKAATLVPIGQHGHGWEPGPQVRREITDADLFVYGMAGFQPWADDIRHDLREDGEDVVPLAAGDGIDLLDADHGGHEADDGHEEGDGHNDEHDGDGHDDEEHDEHDGESGRDPHFWLDPLRAREAVTNLQRGFADVDPANTAQYEENADSYRDRLDALHERFETTLSGRSTDVVLVAGHDAFQYLSDRYEFEVVSLTGLSPDDQPTAKDVDRAQDVISEHGLQYVCADPLESQRAADELVAETAVEAVLPLTSIPGRRDAWESEGWGYVDVMESVNLPTLERALGAE